MDISLNLVPTSPQVFDLLLTDGDLVLTPTQLDQIQQQILQRLRTYYGEWFLDITIGVPWIQKILVKSPNLGTIDALLIAAILGTPGVTVLTKWSFSPNFLTRVLTVDFAAITTAGIVSYSGNLSV